MLSALMMFRRFVGALRHAWSEEDFAPILAAAATLMAVAKEAKGGS